MNDDLGALSDREIEVLKLVATGATNQQIARALVISPNTVKVHLRNIFEKLGVQSRTEATMEAVRRGLVSVPGALLTAPEASSSQVEVTAPTAADAPAKPPVVVDLPVAGRRPVAPWQRVYLFAALLAVIAAALAPAWWRARGQSAPLTPFSDVGQPQVAAAPRPDVGRWTAKAPLPEPRSRLALIAADQKLYAIGGETASGVSSQVTIYDPTSNGWLAGPAKPTAVANVAGALLDGRIYVPGGTTASGSVTNALEVYDPKAATWTTRASLPVPLTAYGLAALNGQLYLFGGWDGAAYRAETYVYDPAHDAWSQAAPMPAPRAFLAASALGDGIYVVGGYDGQRELDTVALYRPADEGAAGGPWTARAPLSQPRGGLGLTTIGTRLYAVGGGWTAALAFNEQYDAKVNAWSRIGTPVVPSWRNLGLAALDNTLYAVGGWSGAYLNRVESYLALLRQMLPLGGGGK